MTIDDTMDNCLDMLSEQYDILHTFDIIQYKSNLLLLQQELVKLHKDVFFPNERIIFTIQEDVYNNSYGILLKSIQSIVNTIDISNFFIIILTTNTNILSEYSNILTNHSSDTRSFEIIQCSGIYNTYNDASIIECSPHNTILSKVSDYTLNLLNDDCFCVLPWVHTQTAVSGKVYPCCNSLRSLPIGQHTLHKNIVNSDNLKNIRKNMLQHIENKECTNCYIDEKFKKTSLRMTSNKKFAMQIDNVRTTTADGSFNGKLIKWDLRFNNLCNLKCRTCSPALSTAWHKDATRLGYSDKIFKQPDNIIQQHMQYIDDVEQIYFAGGEPLIMDEHYCILDELVKRERVTVELVYNTNFTQLSYKGKSIFDYWKRFDSVSVGASLDAMGNKAEYWRSGTKWNIIEKNRRLMMDECPHISFSIDATVSLVNALHIVDFHRNWTDRGFITADQFNPKFLITPSMFSIIQAPRILKHKIKAKIQKHLEWLIPLDRVGRSTNGYTAILNAIEDNSAFDHDGFWQPINDVDEIRNESLLDVFPELECLK